MRIKNLLLLFVLIPFIFSINCTQNNKITAGDKPAAYKEQENNINIELGLPRDDDSTDDYLIYRSQYVLSFNPDRHVANWVSWNLNSDWYGSVDRYDKFISDPELPNNIYQARDNDYKKSGYDKGHTVRSEERTKTEEDNIATFYYTNIMPQTPDLNRGVWLKFERYCENLCKKQDKELFIIAGGIYHSGYTMIGNNVAVPDSCFKIVVILNKGEGLSDVKKSTKIIAVVMPNEDGIRKENWENYTTTVRRIEWSTGYNFLSDVPQDIQDVIESK